MLAFQGGEDEAFDRIVAHYQAEVFRFVLRTVRDAGRAEDLTQDVFLRVFRSRAMYQPAASFRTWLFTIGHRLALNEVRAVRRRRKALGDPGGRGDASDSSEDRFSGIRSRNHPTPVEMLETKELEAVLETLVDTLPENQRAAIQLQRTGDFSYQEIARILEVSTLAVKSLLVRARESLRVGLGSYLGGEDMTEKAEP